MSTRLRAFLVIIAVLILCCALAALGYALWPLDSTQVQATLPPTLFVPP